MLADGWGWQALTQASPAAPCLQAAEARLPAGKQAAAALAGIQVARLSLVRSLAASHMQQPAAA